MAYRQISGLEQARRLAGVRARARELELDAVLCVGVAEIGENRGKGWLSYLFGYQLEHRYGYGLIGSADSQHTLIFPEGMTWALRDMDPRSYRCASYHSQQPLAGVVVELCGEWGVKASGRLGVIGLEEMLPVVDYRHIRQQLPELELIDVSLEMESVRQRKEPAEHRAAHEANRIAEAGYNAIKESIRPGIGLRQLAAEMYRSIYAEGAVDHVMLVLSGANGRCGPTLIAPAGSEQVLARGDVLTFSMELTGPDGYWVEHARTFALGPLHPEYRLLFDAAEAALDRFGEIAIAGRTGGEVYRAIDDLLQPLGLHQGHTPGHSIGQDVLEQPRIAPYDEQPLVDGAIFAFHPHVLNRDESMSAYLADVFEIAPEGAQPLSSVPYLTQLHDASEQVSI